MKDFRVLVSETVTAWITIKAEDAETAEELVCIMLEEDFLPDIKNRKILDIDDYLEVEEIE